MCGFAKLGAHVFICQFYVMEQAYKRSERAQMRGRILKSEDLSMRTCAQEDDGSEVVTEGRQRVVHALEQTRVFPLQNPLPVQSCVCLTVQDTTESPKSRAKNAQHFQTPGTSQPCCQVCLKPGSICMK